MEFCIIFEFQILVNDETMFFQCLQSNEMLFYHYGDPLSVYILEVLHKQSIFSQQIESDRLSLLYVIRYISFDISIRFFYSSSNL